MIPKIVIIASDKMPEHTVLAGNTIMVNVGGMSPDWVLEAVKTRDGLFALALSIRVALDEAMGIESGSEGEN